MCRAPCCVFPCSWNTVLSQVLESDRKGLEISFFSLFLRSPSKKNVSKFEKDMKWKVCEGRCGVRVCKSIPALV